MKRHSTGRLPTFRPQPKVFCIIGDERAYASRSPALFNAVLERHGINGTYVPFNVAPGDLGQALQALRLLNITGANVTAPHKEAAAGHMDILSEGAQIIGAINTVVRVDDQLKGYNTNAIGFMDALVELGFDAADRTALVLGTGGGARAVAFILNWLRTRRIYVAGRNEDSAAELAKRFDAQPRSLAGLPEAPLKVDILVNTTSVSGAGESPELELVVDALTLTDCKLVVDLNYDRPANIWSGLAERLDARFLDGLAPLAHQARRTFALWTGLQVPHTEFLSALTG